MIRTITTFKQRQRKIQFLLIFIACMFFIVIPFNQTKAQSLLTTRTFPNDWWGTNAHDLTHGHELMSADSMDYKNWKKTKVEVLRHPADGYPNDWDWDKGYFITQGKFPCQLPQFDLNKHKNLFTDFQSVAGTMGAGINIDVNPVSSNLMYQLTGLKFASGIGLKVLNVELGEEIYGKNILQNYVYPSASVYADTCKKWIDSIKKYFPSSKIAVVGAPTDGDVRKIGWSTDVLSSPSLINKTVDAVTLHYYPSSGIIDSGVYVSKQLIPTMMEYPYITNHCLFEDIGDIHSVKPAAKIWITEYNMTEKAQRIHGSWAHALFTTLQTMLMLEDSSITQLLLQNTSSDGVRGLLFQDSIGLTSKWYLGFPAPYQCSGATCPVTNEKWQYTALGNSMRLFSTAIRGMNRAAQINFPSAPYFGTDPTHKKIYGWMFTDASTMSSAPSRNLVIINLDSVDHNIGLGSFNVAGGQYEQVWSYDPLVFAGGNAVYNSNDHASVTTPGGYPTIHTSRNPASINLSQRIASSDTASFKLRAYSITYIHNYSGSPTLTASADTICSGQYVTLKATGGAYYTWSMTSGTYNIDSDTSNYISVHPTATGTVTSTYTFKVKAWNNGGTSNGTVTKTIVVRPTPTSFTVTHTLSGCNVVMTASNAAYNYTWFPAVGLNATTGQSVTSSNNPRTYVITASFNPSNQCTYSESHVASRIDSGNHYLAFLNLPQAYNQGNDVMHFGGASDSTKGYPSGGYIIVRKYNESNQFVHKDSIPTTKLQGTGHQTIPCDTAGTYHLTYHYEGVSGCSKDTLRQIIFVNRVQVDASYVTLCPNHLLQLQETHYDNPGGLSFYWSGPTKHLYSKKNPAASDTIHVNTSYQKVFFKSDTAKNYTVTLTVKNGAKLCSKNTIVLTVSGKCSCTKGDSSWVDITASQLLGDLQNIECNTTYNGNTKYGNKIYLYGTFTLDQDLHLFNTQSNYLSLVFGANAQVNVNGYKMLETDSVHLYSCSDSMWNGIVQKGTAASVITNRSWVEDAKNAVYADYGGTVATTKTKFEDNYIGIWFEGRQNLYDYSASSIVSSSFKTVSGLKQPYASIIKGVNGIRVDSVNNSITIGSTTAGLENTFDSLHNGIFSSRSVGTITLNRNIFSRIKSNLDTYPFYGKAGYIKTSTVAPVSVNIVGTGKNASTAAVSNCDFGFFVTAYSNTTIHDYRMDNVPSGIQIENAVSGTMDVYSNKMTNTKYGALFLLNNYCTQDIYNNDITVTAPSTTGTSYFGISIEDYSGAYSTNEVYGNTVTDGRYAIHLLNNGSNSNIHDNTVNMTSTTGLSDVLYGIYAEACSGTKINGNIITGNTTLYNSAYKKEAIMLYQSQSCEVTCDSINKIGRGIHTKGNCSSTIFRGNKLGVSGGGSGNGLFFGMIREYFNGSDAFGNQGDANNSHSNYMYGPFTNGNAWCAYHLNTVNTINFYYNNGDPSYLKTFTQGPAGAFQFNFNPSGSAQLYDCSQFYKGVEEEVDSFSSSAGNESNVGANEIEAWMNNRILYEELRVDTTQIAELGLETFYDTTYQSGIGTLTNFDETLESTSDFQSENVEDLASINQDVPTDLYYEENEKMINDIFLNTVAAGIDTFTNEQKNFIETMALSCPSENGIAVFKARSLYTLVFDSLPVYNDSICSVISEKKSVNKSTSGFNLFPNPTNENTLIEFTAVTEAETELSVFDFIGKLKLKIQIPIGTQFYLLKLETLPAGIYQITLRDNQNEGESRSLVLVR